MKHLSTFLYSVCATIVICIWSVTLFDEVELRARERTLARQRTIDTVHLETVVRHLAAGDRWEVSENPSSLETVSVTLTVDEHEWLMELRRKRQEVQDGR